jgi:hypothetical protein
MSKCNRSKPRLRRPPHVDGSQDSGVKTYNNVLYDCDMHGLGDVCTFSFLILRLQLHNARVCTIGQKELIASPGC